MSFAAALRTRAETRLGAWARRRQGEERLPVRLAARRIYILPTRAGVGFALLTLAMLLAGLNYANSLALFVTFLLVSFGLVAMHQCQRNLLGLEVTAVAAVPAFAGERASLRVVLANPTSLARLGLRLHAPVAAPAELALLEGGASATLETTLACPSRGWMRVDRLRLSSAQPFGLFRAWTWLHPPLEILVYPAPRGSHREPAGQGGRDGGRRAHATGHDEWAGLRAFRDGDSPRQVAWKSYARGAPLLVKEYAAAGGEVRLFEFATLAGLDTEARLEQLARWIVAADARGEHYGLVLPGSRIEPHRGPAHRHRCLAALACHGLEPRSAA